MQCILCLFLMMMDVLHTQAAEEQIKLERQRTASVIVEKQKVKPPVASQPLSCVPMKMRACYLLLVSFCVVTNVWSRVWLCGNMFCKSDVP